MKHIHCCRYSKPYDVWVWRSRHSIYLFLRTTTIHVFHSAMFSAMFPWNASLYCWNLIKLTLSLFWGYQLQNGYKKPDWLFVWFKANLWKLSVKFIQIITSYRIQFLQYNWGRNYSLSVLIFQPLKLLKGFGFVTGAANLTFVYFYHNFFFRNTKNQDGWKIRSTMCHFITW